MLNKMQVINIADGEVGYLEKNTNARLEDPKANAGFNNFTKYGAAQGCNGQPWCDAFVDWCFKVAYGDKKAKELLGGYSNYTPTSASYFKKMLSWYTSPEVGDVIFFKNSTRICHTGIVVAVNKTSVTTIEGNTSAKSGLEANGGCVSRKTYSKGYKSIAGYGRPKYQDLNTATDTPPEIKMGDVNEWVKVLQARLILNGYKLTQDGDFGNNTKNALIAFQGEKGLVKDGIAGPKTWAKLRS